MSENKIVKVIYFDEESAIEYVNISNGGILNKTTNNTKGSEDKGKIDLKASLSAKFSFFNFLNASAGTEAEAEYLQYGKKILVSTVTNSILTDYISIANKDKNILKVDSLKIEVIKDSISHYKLYTPLMKLIELKNQNIDNTASLNLSELDNVLENVKGYYEFWATDEKTSEKKIFRFNSRAFKNNYKMADLTKMKLKFYVVKVGKCEANKLKIENEFKFDNNNELSVDDILEDSKNDNKNDLFYIYDVVLAGVENE